MPLPPTIALAALLLLSASAIGCMPQQQAPAVGSTTHAPAGGTATSTSAGHARSADRHVYRFDFVLAASEGGAAPTSTAFSLNLQEADRGEMVVGKNVPLSPSPPLGSPGPSIAAVRQDVGMKVGAQFHMSGDDVVLDVALEMSTFDPPSTIRKMVAKGNALATVGTPAVVTTLEADNKHYQLTVTPTKLR